MLFLKPRQYRCPQLVAVFEQGNDILGCCRADIFVFQSVPLAAATVEVIGVLAVCFAKNQRQSIDRPDMRALTLTRGVAFGIKQDGAEHQRSPVREVILVIN